MTNVVTESPLSEQEQFRRDVLKALIDSGWTIKELASQIGRSRQATSMAINNGLNAGVIADIRLILNL